MEKDHEIVFDRKKDREDNLKQIAIAANDVIYVCKEGIEHENTWPVIKRLIIEAIKKNDMFFELDKDVRKRMGRA